MKTGLLLLAAATLAVPAPLVLPAAAAAQGRSWVAEFCKADVPNNPPAVVGDCVSLINTVISDSQGVIRHTCAVFEMFAPGLFYANYDGLSECIRDDAGELPPLPE